MPTVEGANIELASWDWWYYTEKLRQEKYNLNEEELRPYFKMENVREGVFMVANKLWGLNFKKLDNIPVYNPEVETYEVTDADGSHIALFYTDYFPRASKRAGAWMSSFRKQTTRNGEDIRPIIYNVGNFTKPLADTPSLLSLDDVETLFHEFGHALHGMLSKVTYRSFRHQRGARLRGTPSQIMEHWAFAGSTEDVCEALRNRRGDTRRADRKDRSCRQVQHGLHYCRIRGSRVARHGLPHPNRRADI